jgi:hypothetical protein
MLSLCLSQSNSMRILRLIFLLSISTGSVIGQDPRVHQNAHAHNDYEHTHPLFDALTNGFISVEADVHLKQDRLVVSHNSPGTKVMTLEQLYLHPLDSILKIHRTSIYPGTSQAFYLMIDCKTPAIPTWQAIRAAIQKFPELKYSKDCPVKIFLSGNRPVGEIMKGVFEGIAVDGRPDDVGKGYPAERMPVISDHFKNWSSWNGKSTPSEGDLKRIKELSVRVHAEGKKLRLWAIPDNQLAWEVLLKSGVDLINTDELEKLNNWLTLKGM